MKSLKLIFYTMFTIGAIFLAVKVYTGLTAPKMAFGKEIIYSNTYINAAHIQSMPNGLLIISDCNAENSSVIVTRDTIILSGHRGTVGLKPGRVDRQMGLHAFSLDSIEFVLIRVKDSNDTTNIKKEMLIVVRPGTPYTPVILSHGTECPEIK